MRWAATDDPGCFSHRTPFMQHLSLDDSHCCDSTQEMSRRTKLLLMRGTQQFPLVSVLTPSFNHGRWLGDALTSVQNQTYPRVEHLVMDGGSNDETLDLLKKAHSNVRWWSEPDQGQSNAINKAFRRSTGEIIGWLNSDDAYFSRFAVSLAVATFSRHPQVAVVFGHAAVVDEASRLLHLKWSPPFSRSLLLIQNFISQPSAFIRRRCLGADLVDETFDFTMDRELWLRLAERYPFRRIDEVLAVDRLHDQRKSIAGSNQMAAERLRLDRAHGAPSAWWIGSARTAVHLASRVLGASLVRAAYSETAFPIEVDVPTRLVRRQLATRRRKMQAGRRK